jgi:hypothetical protein
VEGDRPSPGRTLGFRLVFCYFVLYSVPFPLGSLPWTEKVGELQQKLLDPMVLWVGPNLLGIDDPIATEFNGSGDRTYDYVLVFCLLMLAVAATVIWSLIDRRARRYERLEEGLRVYLRLAVGTIALSYGFAKIFQGQFVPPGAWQLTKTYGDSSPMNLLWTFMGFSRPYTMFAGLMEAIPGALLFFRRTTYAGALLLIAVMGNVVILNLCYDVPVKLYSFHIWLMCVFLAAPAIPRLVSALFLDRPVPPPEESPRLFTAPRARIAAASLYTLLVGALAFQTVYPQWQRHVEMTNLPPAATVVRDLFDVEEMSVNGEVLSQADATRWSRTWIRARMVRIYWPDGRSEGYLSSAEIAGPMTLDLRLTTDAPDRRRARLELRHDGDHLVLEGEFEGKKVRVGLARVELGGSLLMNRGFHWINEFPFNR